MAKKKRYPKRKSPASKADVAVISLIIFSILLAVLIYTKSGIIGLKLNEILGGDWNSTICFTNWNLCNCY